MESYVPIFLHDARQSPSSSQFSYSSGVDNKRVEQIIDCLLLSSQGDSFPGRLILSPSIDVHLAHPQAICNVVDPLHQHDVVHTPGFLSVISLLVERSRPYIDVRPVRKILFLHCRRFRIHQEIWVAFSSRLLIVIFASRYHDKRIRRSFGISLQCRRDLRRNQYVSSYLAGRGCKT